MNYYLLNAGELIGVFETEEELVEALNNRYFNKISSEFLIIKGVELKIKFVVEEKK